MLTQLRDCYDPCSIGHMSVDFQHPTSLAKDSIVPRVLEILQRHDLFRDGLGDSALGGPTLARYLDLNNEVSLYLCREHSTEPVSQAMLTTQIDNEVVSMDECHAINSELDELMASEGRIG